MMQVKAIFTMEGEYETVHKLSNCAIFNDLQSIKRRHSATLNHWMTYTPDIKVTPLFDAEYLWNAMLRDT